MLISPLVKEPVMPPYVDSYQRRNDSRYDLSRTESSNPSPYTSNDSTDDNDHEEKDQIQPEGESPVCLFSFLNSAIVSAILVLPKIVYGL